QTVHWIDVFNRGKKSFKFSCAASEPWILFSPYNEEIKEDQRIWVFVDWEHAPKGHSTGMVKITGAGSEINIKLRLFNPAEIPRKSLRGFAESGGVVSIEPEHFTRNTNAKPHRWIRIEDYGRTLSGMRATAPADAPSATPGKKSACLEYKMYLFDSG